MKYLYLSNFFFFFVLKRTVHYVFSSSKTELVDSAGMVNPPVSNWKKRINLVMEQRVKKGFAVPEF